MSSLHTNADASSSKVPPPIEVPPGHKLYTENQTSILLADAPDAFLNPAQEFNRDLSVACITTWSEQANEAKRQKWLKKQEKKKATDPNGEEPKSKKLKDDPEGLATGSEPSKQSDFMDVDSRPSENVPLTSQAEPKTFILLEALSATGLRAIRYAKEIPLLKYVIANDLSPAAIAAMKRNVEINGLAPPSAEAESGKSTSDAASSSDPTPTAKKPHLGKVRINQGDACDLMYSHRSEKNRVDVVDLDPYGTAAPFMDSAIQCIRDDGLLCVTCTDTSVLANNNYPEKCFANYGGVPARAEYCHEIALRLVLHALSTTAARYGRYVTPLLSLSIDFYVRLFVRIRTAPIEVKKAISKTAIYHICTGCQAFHAQPLGRVVEKRSANGQVNPQFKTSAADQNFNGACSECGSNMHLAGPMWSGPLHDRPFVAKVLEHVKNSPDNYKFSTRMEGMLTLAHEVSVFNIQHMT
ncbi:RNA methyltransferase tRNA(m5U54)methyltransferase [Tulasnella sp. 418]|nr:RNA methyltransferase tRNA(m5U54)methyltransferase [Tulasnella sp. 418]